MGFYFLSVILTAFTTLKNSSFQQDSPDVFYLWWILCSHCVLTAHEFSSCYMKTAVLQIFTRDTAAWRLCLLRPVQTFTKWTLFPLMMNVYWWISKDFRRNSPIIKIPTTCNAVACQWLFQHIEIVTLMPRLPLSANRCAMLVSNTRQSLFIMADCTPSWMLRGVASQVRRLRWPFSSSLKLKVQILGSINILILVNSQTVFPEQLHHSKS